MKRSGITVSMVLAASCLWASEGELRGLWVDCWNPGILDRVQCEQLVKTARANGFNALFIEVRKTGDACYHSSFVPRATNIEEGFDPLATVIELAHDTTGGKRRLEVHAWGVVYRVWRKTQGRPPDERHVILKNPEWLNLHRVKKTESEEGMYLDPAHPEAQEHLVQAFLEIAENYDVDGLHLDYVRYPDGEWGYTPTSLQLYEQLTGASGTPSPADPAWMHWRRFQVTSFVRRLYGELACRKPSVRLSAALTPWGGVEKGYEGSAPMTRTFQDWVLWKEKGFLDWLCLMNYKRQHVRRQASDFKDWCQLAHDAPGQAYDAIGMGNYLNSIANSAIQMKAIRDIGNDGAVVYCYNDAAKGRETTIQLFRSLNEKYFQPPATPPECTWKKETGTLVIHLLDADGVPRRLHRVMLRPVRRSGVEPVDSVTDVNGWTVFCRLEPGPYDLVVPETREGTGGEPVRRVSITAGEGTRVVTTALSES